MLPSQISASLRLLLLLSRMGPPQWDVSRLSGAGRKVPVTSPVFPSSWDGNGCTSFSSCCWSLLSLGYGHSVGIFSQ